MGNSAKQQIRYPILLSTRVDWETRKELNDISLFDRKKVSTWVRDLVVDAIKRYQRNPQYKKFKRELERRKFREEKV